MLTRHSIWGFVIGFGFAIVLGVFAVSHERRTRFELGFGVGYISGLNEAATALAEEFGTLDDTANGKVLFSVKTTDVIVVEVNGVATLRVIE